MLPVVLISPGQRSLALLRLCISVPPTYQIFFLFEWMLRGWFQGCCSEWRQFREMDVRSTSSLCLTWDVENSWGTRADGDTEGLWNRSACWTGNCRAPESLLSQSVMSDSMRRSTLSPARLLCPWHSPGKNTGVGCHVLLQAIFPTQG